MSNSQTRRFNGVTLKSALKISSLLIVATIITWSTFGQNSIAESLFQSPPTSPVATPTPPPPPAATNTPVPPPATAVPTESQPSMEATATPETATDTTDAQNGEVTPQPESEQPDFTPTPLPIEANPLAPVVPQATEVVPVIPSEPRPTMESSTPTGERVINEAKLIDTLITWAARSMMCFGVLCY